MIKDVTIAIAQFEAAASCHAISTESGDYKKANKSHADIVQSINFLKESHSMERLFGFLKYTSVGVRLWAATYFLPISEKEGLKALKNIMSENDINSFTAEMTISEWKKGNLQL